MNNRRGKIKIVLLLLTFGLSLKKKFRLHANFSSTRLLPFLRLFHVEHGIERESFLGRKREASINIIARRVVPRPEGQTLVKRINAQGVAENRAHT